MAYTVHVHTTIRVWISKGVGVEGFQQACSRFEILNHRLGLEALFLCSLLLKPDLFIETAHGDGIGGQYRIIHVSLSAADLLITNVHL